MPSCARCSIESTKLKAIKGKLVNVLERSGVAPNGTEFAITTGGAPELDDTNLIVGRVVEGMDIVSSLSKLPVVKNNSSSPFFQAGAHHRAAPELARLHSDLPVH